MALELTALSWLAAYVAMLVAAVWRDATARRIPNWAVLPGAVLALALSIAHGGIGFGSSMSGLVAGLAVLLPFRLLRVMGAGDVKLLAAVGAFVGFPGVLRVALIAFLAGGVMSLAWAIRFRNVRAVLRNVRAGLCTTLAAVATGKLPRAGDLPVTAVRVPYALAIATGATAYAFLSGNPGWNMPA